MTKKSATPKTNYELIDPITGEHRGTFTGRQPRQAALKAARKHEQILLKVPDSRDGGKVKCVLEVFRGTCETVPKPDSAPAWMKGDTIQKTSVSKIGKFKVPAETGSTIQEAIANYLKENNPFA